MPAYDLDDFLSELLEEIDHDIAKGYRPDTAEDPEAAEDALETLKDIVRKYFGHESGEEGE